MEPPWGKMYEMYIKTWAVRNSYAQRRDRDWVSIRNWGEVYATRGAGWKCISEGTMMMMMMIPKSTVQEGRKNSIASLLSDQLRWDGGCSTGSWRVLFRGPIRNAGGCSSPSISSPFLFNPRCVGPLHGCCLCTRGPCPCALAHSPWSSS